MAQIKKNPIVTLKAQAKGFDFSKLRADKNNSLANSGETVYLEHVFKLKNELICEA